MTSTKKKRATSPESGGPTEVFTTSTDSTSRWRQQYKVHPAADVFPMMSDAELAKLGEDIKANGLEHPILWWDRCDGDKVLIDGRNRLEAMERAGIPAEWCFSVHYGDDPVSRIISNNIHRRHLTKQQQAELIVAAFKAAAMALYEEIGKPHQVDEVSKGGRGKVNKVKADAVAAAKEHGIGKSTVERAFAKAEGRKPKPKSWKSQPVNSGLDAARRAYFDWCAKLDADLDAELETIRAAFKEIIGKRAASVAVSESEDEGSP